MDITDELKLDATLHEKDGFSKFETELKESVFNIAFLLVNSENNGLFWTAVGGFIELMQLLGFPFLYVP